MPPGQPEAEPVAAAAPPASATVSTGLPLDLVLRACSLLPPNDIACTARLLCKATAQHFSEPHHRTVRLSQPVPPHAFSGRYGRGADPTPLRQLSLKLKERLLALTATSGSLENVAALVERMEPPFWWRRPDPQRNVNCTLLLMKPEEPHGDACAAAARARHMHVVRYLVERGYPYDKEATAAAVLKHCDLADALWLEQRTALHGSPIYQGGEQPDAVVRAAASSVAPDAVAKLKWLLARNEHHRQTLLPRAAAAAAGADNLEGLQWVLGQVGEAAAELRASLLESAAVGNGLRVTAWLLGQGGVAVARAALTAASAGQGEALRLLLPRSLEELPAGEVRKALLEEGFQRVACSGRLGAMQLVAELAAAHGHAEAVAPDDFLVRAGLQHIAFKGGDVEAARWLWRRRASQVGMLSMVTMQAAAACSVPMLSFLCEEAGAQWDMGSAGHYSQALCSSGKGAEVVAVLQWLQERGCPGEDYASATMDGLRGGEVEVLQWLHSKGILGQAMFPHPISAECCLDDAAHGGCEAVVEWLLAAGCPMGQDGGAYIAAGRNGDLVMLRCLRRLGVPWGPDTVLQAVQWRGGGLPVHVARWMVGEGGALVDGRAVQAAAEGSELREVLRAAAHAAAAGGTE